MDDFGLMGTVACQKKECGLAVDGVAEAQSVGKGHDATRPVAAHVGRQAVGIKVLHDEVIAIGRGSEQDKAVGSHTETAVTDAGDLVGGETDVVLTIVDEDKVVPRPVIFAEGYYHRGFLDRLEQCWSPRQRL